MTVNNEAISAAFIELGLYINTRLFERGIITETMYLYAKEIIVKG